MSLFDQLGKSPQTLNKNQLAQMANQLQQNPLQFLQAVGYNIPNNINLKDPNSIINFLVQSRQINGGLISVAQQLLNNLK